MKGLGRLVTLIVLGDIPATLPVTCYLSDAESFGEPQMLIYRAGEALLVAAWRYNFTFT